MKIDGGPSLTAMQHMAARAPDARRTAAAEIPAAMAAEDTAPSAGNDAPETGENLPLPTADSRRPRGLEGAIERLQANAAKNPQAKGLLTALEMLQRNLQQGSRIDTQA